MTCTITASHLTKQYRRRTANAVNDVTFSIEAGEVIGLLGPNGAGKTTLIKLLCGVIPPTGGSATILGLDTVRDSLEVKRSIGVVHQQSTFDLFLNPYDNLQIAAAFRGLRWASIKPRVDALIEVFKLNDKLSVPVFTLSGGERRRLQVVRALLTKPRILLLDEPSAGLDVSSRLQVWSLLHELRAETQATIIWTSHYVEELERNCNRVMILDRGELVRFEAVSSLVQAYGRSRVIVEFPEEADPSVVQQLNRLDDFQVQINNRRVEISAPGRRDPMPAVLDILQDLLLRPANIQFLPANLEDAFLALLERHEHGHIGSESRAVSRV